MSLYAGLEQIDADLWVVGREPPAYDLNDNGISWWPPVCHFAERPEEWPFVAEAWEKYWSEDERRRSRRIRDLLECGVCHARFQRWQARQHVDQEHYGRGRYFVGGPAGPPVRVVVSLQWVNPLWTWQMLGFEDLWYGRPSGNRSILDPRDPRVQQWEADALELGTLVADHLWRDEP